MIRELVTDMPRVSVESYDCLTVKFAAKKRPGACCAACAASGVEYEFHWR